MLTVIRFITLLCLLVQLSSCAGQGIERALEDHEALPSNGVVGGPFENAEYMYIDTPAVINSVDTSPGWNIAADKLMITGTIFELDGRTPASDVLLYYYQTNEKGIYANSADLNPAVRRHGYIRGWVKTGKDGRYTIYTMRPGEYPGRTEPAHIHLSVKEPNISKEYYIHDLNFDDDPAINTEFRKGMENRAGSGILRLLKKDDLYVAEHNIILGLNIPNYPVKEQQGAHSGPAIGEDIKSFTPLHIWGPDKGKKSCPICKYGRHQGILYFVGNEHSWSDLKKWMTFFEEESVARGTYLKVYFILDETAFPDQKNLKEGIEALGRSLNIEETAITVVPSLTDTASKIHENLIDPDLSNTILLYQQSTIVDKFLGVAPTEPNFQLIRDRLNETRSDYYNLIPIHLLTGEN